jgi:hypothetical protein
MSDVFSRQETAIQRVKALKNLQLIDGTPIRVQASCDDMATYRLEDCLSCPQRRECEPEEQP